MKNELPCGSVLTILKPIQDFLRLESAGGILLMAAAALALILANSPLAGVYGLLIDLPVEIRIGPFEIAKPLLLWINDGLMAVFFFLVALELKREAWEGELSDPRVAALPAVGALGGMIGPAAIYVFINRGNAVALNGWAIPSATDIAFALGVLLLLGPRVPTPLKVFLVSLAIFDDLGAILIIALFYSGDLSTAAMLTALACLIPLWILNRLNVTDLVPYILIGMVLWAAVVKSGVHATLAGAVLAWFIPLRDKRNPDRSPLRELEHDLHTAVAFGVLPLFAFANSGIDLAGVGLEHLLHPVPLGIAAGLFVGKQLGVLAFCGVAIKSGFAKLPAGTNWGDLYGVALLCGIGFTMSFFIGSLSFEHAGVNRLFDERLGIIIGSLLSAVAGYLVLRRSLAIPK